MVDESLIYLNIEYQLPAAHRRLWEQWQSKYDAAGFLLRIDHSPTANWRMMLDPNIYVSQSKRRRGNQDPKGSAIINDAIAYAQRSNKKGKFKIAGVTKSTYRGLYAPLHEISRLAIMHLNAWLNFYLICLKEIDLNKFFHRFIKEINADSAIDICSTSLFAFLRQYNEVIHEHALDDNKGELPRLSEFFHHHASLHFAAEECIYRLLTIIEDQGISIIKDGTESWQVQSKFSIVDIFLQKNITKIIAFVRQEKTNTSLLESFLELCKKDQENYLIQELIDNRSEFNIVSAFSSDIQKSIANTFSRSIADRLKNIIGNQSIIDRIRSVNADDKDDNFPDVPRSIQSKESDITDHWSEVTDEITIEIKNSIPSLNADQQKQCKEISETRHTADFLDISNVVLWPIFRIDPTHEGARMQLNIHADPEARQLAELNQQRELILVEEREQLQNLLSELHKLNYPSDVQRLSDKAKPFLSEGLQTEWDTTWQNHKTTLSNKLSYRRGRMIELGILTSEEGVSLRKDLWLNEMLLIEKEIKPYIGYVRSAFAAVLPVRTKVRFDPYRHSYDGIEFDPSTIMDQNKWVRGEIMHNLEHKTSTGRIEQVNCFCLDYSGSMDHERMRGLFKILYLLILGLEDRKTYDALHFFSTSFMKTASFRDGYTNRSLMFEVLSRVAKIKGDKIVYGGQGGTNISEAIHVCNLEIEIFVNQLKRMNPDIKVASSIFVITDGEPTLGIVDNDDLADFIDEKRNGNEVSIKGIYLNPDEMESGFVKAIFGKDSYVESKTFEETVHAFVNMMTSTYARQRKDYRWNEKKKVVRGTI